MEQTPLDAASGNPNTDTEKLKANLGRNINMLGPWSRQDTLSTILTDTFLDLASTRLAEEQRKRATKQEPFQLFSYPYVALNFISDGLVIRVYNSIPQNHIPE